MIVKIIELGQSTLFMSYDKDNVILIISEVDV